MTLMLAALWGQSPFMAVGSFSKDQGFKPGTLSAGSYSDAKFSPDGSRLVVAYNGTPYLQIFNTSTWEKLTFPMGVLSATPYISYSPGGDLLACGQGSGSQPYLRVLNTSNWTQVSIADGVTSTVSAVEFSPDGTMLAVAHSAAPFLTVYDVATWTKKTLSGGGPAGALRGISFSRDSSMLATVCDASTPRLAVYRTIDFAKLSGVPQPTSNGRAVAFNADGTQLVVAYFASPYISAYKVSDWSSIPITSGVLPGAPTAFGASPGGNLLAVAHAGAPYATIYDMTTWAKIPLPSYIDLPQTPSAIAFSNQAPLVIRGGVRDVDNNVAARTVRVLERSSGRICATTTSDPVTGDYSAKVYEGDVDYDVQFMAAPGELLNDLFFARVRAGAP